MRLTGLIAVTCIALIISAVSAGPTDIPSDNGEGETTVIDTETAAKLAMVASYHKQYGQALKHNLKLFGKTDRVFVSSFDLSSLDGNEKFYTVTVYRGEGEPESLEEISERVAKWAEGVASFAEKKEDGTYILNRPDPGSIQNLYFFGTFDEFCNYYSCVVPASTSQGFLFRFDRGISPYSYLGELGRVILAADLGVETADVEITVVTSGLAFLCEVSGEEYIVDLSGFHLEKSAKIIKGEAVAEFIEKGGSESASENGPATPVEEAAKEEDITAWLFYVELIEDKYGFGPGPSITADSVNPVLMGHNERTLYQDGSSSTILYHPIEGVETEE